MKKMKYGEKTFDQHVTVCHCMSEEHQFTFTFDPDSEENEFLECYLDVHLYHGRRGFFRRVWHAVKFVFGYKSRYGNWDGAIVSREEARKLRDLFDKYYKFCESKDGSAVTDSDPPLPPSR
jgi:hypothetical protein